MELQTDAEVRKFGALELFAREIVAGFMTGLHKSPFHGFSVEFAEHKPYNKGDSTRHIDWKRYAKTEKLYLKQYEEETNLRCQLVIDQSSSMLFPKDGNYGNKLQFAVKAAAALTHLLRSQRDAVGITLFDEVIQEYIPAKLNDQHLQRVYSMLETLQQRETHLKGTSASEALNELAQRIPSRSLVVLFSDMLANQDDEGAAVFQALQHLRFKKHEVVIFHVLDASKERELDFGNHPYELQDIETGKKVRLNPSQVKTAYSEVVNKRFENLDVQCGLLGIDFIPVDIAQGFETVLFNYLKKRQALVR